MTPLVTLVGPFINLAARTPNKITFDRMQNALIVPLLDALAARLAVSSSTDDTELQRKRKRPTETYASLFDSVCKSQPENGSPDIREAAKNVLAAIFDAAGKEEAKDTNRRKMYVLWRTRTEEFEGPTPENSVTV